MSSGSRPCLVILGTGGTIAGVSPSPTAYAYTAGTVLIDALVAAIPDLKSIADFRAEQFSNIGSENMSVALWIKLARRVQALALDPTVDGIIITHGTDTIGETAYFLHLVVKTAKPIVIVGAMSPSTALGADGTRNLYQAALVASNPLSHGKGVMVCLAGSVHSARTVRKIHTVSQHAFDDGGFGPLAQFCGSTLSFTRAPFTRHTLDTPFDIKGLADSLPMVAIIYAYADIQPDIVANLSSAYAGIIIAGFGDGTLNTGLLLTLQERMRHGAIVVRSSRVGRGPTTLTHWGESYEGMLASFTLNPQKARVLLMLALTLTQDPHRIQDFFLTY